MPGWASAGAPGTSAPRGSSAGPGLVAGLVDKVKANKRTTAIVALVVVVLILVIASAGGKKPSPSHHQNNGSSSLGAAPLSTPTTNPGTSATPTTAPASSPTTTPTTAVATTTTTTAPAHVTPSSSASTAVIRALLSGRAAPYVENAGTPGQVALAAAPFLGYAKEGLSIGFAPAQSASSGATQLWQLLGPGHAVYASTTVNWTEVSGHWVLSTWPSFTNGH